MALFHARSPGVIQLSFTIYSLENPILTTGMDGSTMEAKSLLLMLSSEEPDEKALEVLSHLSSLMIESEENTAVFQSGDKNQILSFLSSEFEKFFTEKIDLLRSV